jgi:mono/diheme cytochrome c family protein
LLLIRAALPVIDNTSEMIKHTFFLLVILMMTGCNSGINSKTITKRDIQKGEALFNSVGCTTCHSVTGKVLYGPALNTVFQSEIVVLRDGEKHTETADRDYIIRSMQNPDFEKVDGFQDRKMPKPDLTPEEIDQIADYLISLKK